MSHNTSDSDNEITTTKAKLFEHDIHQALGGKEVADILLWRNKKVSAAILIGMTVIWFLFEVVDYNLVPLLCHISITVMLVLFIWSTAAQIFNWNAPKIPDIILQDDLVEDLASIFHRGFKQLLPMLHYISSGIDLPRFLLIIFSLYILSVIGTYLSFVNLLYIGFLCMLTLPIGYERYEEEINNLVGNFIMDLRKKYKKFEKRYLSKIPRRSVKEKKTM
ncbi:hypothetical protein PIB30_055416 [Stylosanthes scabra]|uniref:Reticulon-like protein n=1 Tax=Stylosanthes scabra TaxID=79078 RepID=A0ABU6YJ91_9FABA|nr:hypothetical protein [Stylosanthes scabra]